MITRICTWSKELVHDHKNLYMITWTCKRSTALSFDDVIMYIMTRICTWWLELVHNLYRTCTWSPEPADLYMGRVCLCLCVCVFCVSVCICECVCIYLHVCICIKCFVNCICFVCVVFCVCLCVCVYSCVYEFNVFTSDVNWDIYSRHIFFPTYHYLRHSYWHGVL